MTIRVTVTNADSGETRIISAQPVNLDGSTTAQPPPKELKGGESTDLYVHSSQNILVKEVRNG